MSAEAWALKVDISGTGCETVFVVVTFREVDALGMREEVQRML